MLLQPANVVFEASHVPLWVMVSHYVSQPKHRVVEKFFFFLSSNFLCLFLTRSVSWNRAPQIHKFVFLYSHVTSSRRHHLMSNCAHLRKPHSPPSLCRGQCHNRMRPLHGCCEKKKGGGGIQTEWQQVKTPSKEGHVCVLLNPGNPHSQFLICLCKRDWEEIRCWSASLE